MANHAHSDVGHALLFPLTLLLILVIAGVVGYHSFGIARSSSGAWLKLSQISPAMLYIPPVVDPSGAAARSGIGYLNGVSETEVAGPMRLDELWQRKIESHVNLIGCARNIGGVLSSSAGDARQSQWYQRFNGSQSEAARWLHEHLRVRHVHGTALIEVSLPSGIGAPDPDEAVAIVNQIVERHVELVRRCEADAVLDAQQTMDQIRFRLERQIVQIDLALRDDRVESEAEMQTLRLERHELRERLNQVRMRLDGCGILWEHDEVRWFARAEAPMTGRTSR
jgi:hypothetical protein